MFVRKRFYFAEHALLEIDNDDLEIEDVMSVAQTGTVIENYPTDKPYPSYLALGWFGKIPVHVVLNENLPLLGALKFL